MAGRALPVWDALAKGFTDPDTRAPLPTWDQACAELEQPAHVARFGDQVHAKGVLGGTEEAGRHIGYLTKYLTKSITDAAGLGDGATERQRVTVAANGGRGTRGEQGDRADRGAGDRQLGQLVGGQHGARVDRADVDAGQGIGRDLDAAEVGGVTRASGGRGKGNVGTLADLGLHALVGVDDRAVMHQRYGVVTDRQRVGAVTAAGVDGDVAAETAVRVLDVDNVTGRGRAINGTGGVALRQCRTGTANGKGDGDGKHELAARRRG